MSFAAIILAAGLGTRMKSQTPKVMHKVAGRPMLMHLLASVESLKPEKIVVVLGPGMEDTVGQNIAPYPFVVQHDRLGTGHAVAQARAVLEDFKGPVLVLYGDTPLITPETLEKMLKATPGQACVVLGFRPENPGAYGRLVTAGDKLSRIVEAKDASPAELKINLCNSGVMAIDGARLWQWLAQVDNKNAKGEYYLTDLVGIAGKDNASSKVIEGDEEELIGVNSRLELAEIEAILQKRLRREAMENGATLIDPNSVYFSWDTQIGQDVTIAPNVFFGPKVRVGNQVEIRSFCHIEGAEIGPGAIIGPFARLRPGAKLAEDAHVGNFVEIKNASVAKGAKVNHLTYIGDAKIGANANIGAGTITCNYDGFTKSLTEIGDNAFIGSNTALVAPVKIGAGAIVGAGSVITKDVEDDALAVTRSEQKQIKSWARKFRDSKRQDSKRKVK